MNRLATAVATIAAAAAIAGVSACGVQSSSAEETSTAADQPVLGVGQERAGSTSALAQCSDWLEGTEEEKQATVDDLYNQVNQAGADGPTPDLTDEEAFELFERTCPQDYAVKLPPLQALPEQRGLRAAEGAGGAALAGR